MKKKHKNKKPRIIIVCENNILVKKYNHLIQELKKQKFISFDSIVVSPIINKNINLEQILKDLITYTKNQNFNEKWIVLDKNNQNYFFETFNKFRKKAKKYNITIGYDNQSFELWYLLNFKYKPLKGETLEKFINYLKFIDSDE